MVLHPIWMQCLHNLDTYIPVRMINISVPVSDYCILYTQVPVIFIYYSTNRGNFLEKIRPPWFIASLALLNATIVLQLWLLSLISSNTSLVIILVYIL